MLDDVDKFLSERQQLELRRARLTSHQEPTILTVAGDINNDGEIAGVHSGRYRLPSGTAGASGSRSCSS
jgi:hypothetical protein